MTTARKLRRVHYPETDHAGKEALQRFIADELRPAVAGWLHAHGRRWFVGANQFFYTTEGEPARRVAPDVYVLPGVDPDAAPPCWKRWEIPEGPSFALDIVSEDSREDDRDAHLEHASLGTGELVTFDPRTTARVRWQVYRRVGERGFHLVEKSNEDRVYARELKCFLRVVGEGPSTRLRLARGEHGDDIVPTAEERLVAELAAQGATLSSRNAELAAQRAEIAQLRAALRRRKPRP